VDSISPWERPWSWAASAELANVVNGIVVPNRPVNRETPS
jgi:hypothetical protein